MDYKILKADPLTGQIQVEYSDSGTSLGNVALDVPIVSGAFMTGSALHAEILSRAPTWALDRKSQVASATGFAAIEVAAETGSPAIVPLELVKEARARDVNKHRERVIRAGVIFMGYQFDSDDLSVTRLTAVVSAVGAGVTLPADFVWRSSINVDVPMNATGLVGLLATMIMRANEIYTQSWSIKQLIADATTAAEVAAVRWDDPLAGSME